MNALEHEEGPFRLTSDELSVRVHSLGARITSLVSRATDASGSRSRGAHPWRPPYGARFTDTDHFGWDEMFPSVDACAYPVEPFTGLDVVDHGELWSLRWADGRSIVDGGYPASAQ